MLAAVVTREGTVEVRHAPDPVVGPYDAVCRMLYGSICAGTDTHIVRGSFGLPVQYPSIIGHESVGEVIEIGSRVEHLKVGDHVTRVSAQASTAGLALSWGGLCEYGVARDHEAMQAAGEAEEAWRSFRRNLVIPPGLLSPAYEPMFITWRETNSYVRRIGVRPGSDVVISGSGANGLAIAAMASCAGAARVTVIGSAARNSECLRVADNHVDYRDPDAVRAFVDGSRGAVDVLVDATGQSGSLNRLLPILKRGGTLGVYGMDSYGNYALDPTLASSFSFYNDGYDEVEAHGPVASLVGAGALDPAVWIDQERAYDWSNVADAFTAAADRSLIKPLVKLSDGGVRA